MNEGKDREGKGNKEEYGSAIELGTMLGRRRKKEDTKIVILQTGRTKTFLTGPRLYLDVAVCWREKPLHPVVLKPNLDYATL